MFREDDTPKPEAIRYASVGDNPDVWVAEEEVEREAKNFAGKRKKPPSKDEDTGVNPKPITIPVQESNAKTRHRWRFPSNDKDGGETKKPVTIPVQESNAKTRHRWRFPSNDKDGGETKKPVTLPVREGDVEPAQSQEINFVKLHPAVPYSNEPKKVPIRPLVFREGEITNEDGSIVHSNAGSYGLICGGYVWYANEISKQCYNIMVEPITSKWREIDPSTFPKEVKAYGKKTYSVYVGRKEVDIHSLKAMASRCYNLPPDSIVDFSSVFAFTFACGIPLDFERECLVLDVLKHIFVPGTRPPTPLMKYLQRVFPMTHREMPQQDVAKEGMIDDMLLNEMMNCNSHIGVVKVNGRHFCSGVMIKENKGLTVAHVPDEIITFVIHGKEWPIEKIASSVERDICVFKIADTRFPSIKDITSHIITEKDLATALSKQRLNIPGMLSTKTYIGKEIEPINNMCSINSEIVQTGYEVAGSTGKYHAELQRLGVSGVSTNGWCGSVLYISNRAASGKMCGIHKAGSNTVSYCVYITQEYINRILANPESIGDMVKQEAIIPVRDPAYIDMAQQAVIHRPTGLLQVGTLSDPCHMPDTTRIMSTGLYLADFMGEEKYEPSAMSPTDPRNAADGTGLTPKVAGLKRYATPGTDAHVNRTEIIDAMECIGNHLANLIEAGGRTVRTLTKTEALNRLDLDEYPKSRPIDRNGSVGWKHNYKATGPTNKGHFMWKDEDGTWRLIDNGAGREISKEADLIVDQAKIGKESVQVFMAYLKDEPLKLKKIYEARKTRMFFSPPFPYLIVYRRYFLSAMQRVTELYNQTPVKVGISTHMEDWHHMIASMLAVGPTGFASDVACFDSSVPSTFLEEVKRVYDVIYERCSIKGEDIQKNKQIRAIVHRAVEGSYVLCGHALFKFLQAQVSGNPGTATENSFIMWALYYIAWKELAIREGLEDQATFAYFMKHVYAAIYGDDNMCSVAPGHEWFHYHSFKEIAEKYGFKVTDAGKRGGVVPGRESVLDLEFLKRKTVKIGGFYAGQLAMSSIVKSCEWIRGHKSYKITEEHIPSMGGSWPINTNAEVISESIDSNWPEIALHGEEVYNRLRGELLRQCGAKGIDISPPRWADALVQLGYYVK